MLYYISAFTFIDKINGLESYHMTSPIWMAIFCKQSENVLHGTRS